MSYIGKTALIRIGGKILQGAVTRDKIPNEYGYPTDMEVTVRGGKTHRCAPFDEKIAVLVPEDEIHPAWKKVLTGNPKAKISVCYRFATDPQSTTLVCRKTLERLRGTTTCSEGYSVHLWKGLKTPSEGKPEILDSETTYTVGKTEISLDAVDRYL